MKIPGQKLLTAIFRDVHQAVVMKQPSANATAQEVSAQEVAARAAHAESLVNFIQKF